MKDYEDRTYDSFDVFLKESYVQRGKLFLIKMCAGFGFFKKCFGNR